jgi:hypothetical protein
MKSLLNLIFIVLIITISILGLYSLIPSVFASSPNNTQNSEPLATEKRLPPLTPGLELETAPQPNQLSEEDKFFFKKGIDEVNTLPPIPESNEPILGPSNGTATGVNATVQNTTLITDEPIKRISESTGENSDTLSLVVIENKTLTPGRNNVFSIMDASVSNKNDTVFYTGNIYTARSLDGGISWEFASPLEIMGDACCDQISYYAPKYDIFIWYIQGKEKEFDSPGPVLLGENRIKIGISSDAKTWKYLIFKPSDINSTLKHHSSDYPYLAVTDKYLYISMNLAKREPFSDKELVGPIVLRISLADLAAAISQSGTTIGPRIDSYSDPSLPPGSPQSYTLVQGANDTMYWGYHISNNLMRIYEWPDSVSYTFVKSFDRHVPAWKPFTRGEGKCLGPDYNDWCQRGVSKIRGAFMVNDVIGFLWDANGTSIDNTTKFKYPYIDAATFNTKDNMTHLARPYLWSPDFAWMYASVAPDNQGNVAILAFFGGGNHHPSIAAGVGNDFTGQVIPWKMSQLVKGTNGPSDNEWGDYVTIRLHNGEGPGWIGSAWTLFGGSEDENIVPRYFEFKLENKNSSLSIPVTSTKSLFTDEQYYSIKSTNFLPK